MRPSIIDFGVVRLVKAEIENKEVAREHRMENAAKHIANYREEILKTAAKSFRSKIEGWDVQSEEMKKIKDILLIDGYNSIIGYCIEDIDA